jgi:hypothetical protein
MEKEVERLSPRDVHARNVALERRCLCKGRARWNIQHLHETVAPSAGRSQRYFVLFIWFASVYIWASPSSASEMRFQMIFQTRFQMIFQMIFQQVSTAKQSVRSTETVRQNEPPHCLGFRTNVVGPRHCLRGQVDQHAVGSVNIQTTAPVLLAQTDPSSTGSHTQE